MRFTPVIFAGVAAAGIYYPEPSSSAPATSSTPAWPVKASSGAYDPAGYWPQTTSSSSSSSSVKKSYKTSTKYETECWTVTSSSSTKVWTSVKAIPTVCDDDDDTWSIPATTSKSTPAAPVKPTGTWSVPYCEAYTETCTVTVTASASESWAAPVKSTTPAAPVKPTTPAAPVYSSVGGSWPAGAAKPSGTGSWTSPYTVQFTGAASVQKAGAVLAGAGAVAAMLL